MYYSADDVGLPIQKAGMKNWLEAAKNFIKSLLIALGILFAFSLPFLALLAILKFGWITP